MKNKPKPTLAWGFKFKCGEILEWGHFDRDYMKAVTSDCEGKIVRVEIREVKRGKKK